MRDPKPVNDRGQVSRGELQRLAADVARLRRMTSAGPFEVVSGPGGTHFRDAAEPSFLAVITDRTEASNPYRYGWRAVQSREDGGNYAIPGYGEGTTEHLFALEIRGQYVEVNTPVRLYRAGPNHFVFQAPAAFIEFPDPTGGNFLILPRSVTFNTTTCSFETLWWLVTVETNIGGVMYPGTFTATPIDNP